MPHPLETGLRAAVVLPLLAATLAAAPAFRGDQSLAAIGLRIRPLAESVPEPPAPPKTYAYVWTRGDERVTRDRYDPAELWLASQHAGQWRDPAGHRLTLGRMTHLPPVIEPQAEHVDREVFEAALAKPAARLAPGNRAHLAAWITAFTGAAPGPAQPLRTGYNLADALYFPTAPARQLVYAFRVKSRAIHRARAPSDWFCAVVEIADATPPDKVRELFETQFLGNATALDGAGTAAAARRAAAASTLTGRAGQRPASVPDDPVREAARRSIANMRGWWSAETDAYIFLSDLGSASGKALIRELQATLPALHDAFSAMIPPFDATRAVSVVRIFSSADDYRHYVGPDHAWTHGLWSPMHRELVIRAEDQNRDGILEIIRHEGFHQYLFQATGMREQAIWFNEGHACLFEAAEVGGGRRVTIGEGTRVRHLLDNLPAVVRHIPAVLRMAPADFYTADDEDRRLNYTTAWSLVYFLRKGAPSRRLRTYAAIPDAYLDALRTAQNPAAATAAAFQSIDMERFQADFADFWKKGRGSARRYRP